MDEWMVIGPHAAIPLSDVVIRASRSSGPGGQHANVTASRIEASLDVAACESLTEGQRRTIIARTGPRVVATAQDTRSQARNRELALERLRGRLEQALAVPRPRRATRPTRAAEERRLEAKRRQGARKRSRATREDPDSA
jgi:ribosome-associated protein